MVRNPSSSFFFSKFTYLFFIFGCVGSSLLRVAASGGYSLLQCAGFSLRWLLLWWSTGSRRGGMWDLPGPGLDPVSPALADRFLTTAPPGKPGILLLIGTFLGWKGGERSISFENCLRS